MTVTKPSGMRLILRRILVTGFLLAAWSATIAGAAAPETDALRETYPEYRAALAALGDEQIRTAIEGLSKLVDSQDPNLAADAAFFLGRALVLEERFEEALPLFARITAVPADKTTHVGEALYMRGLCEARLMKRKDAIASFDVFLDHYKQAPERMRVDAWRQSSELKRVKDGSIEDVQQHMDYSRRRLALDDAGKNTRLKQHTIVTMLTQLIKERDKDKDSDDENSKQDQKPGKGNGQANKPGKPGAKKGNGPPGSNPGGGNYAPSTNDVVGRQHTGGREGFGSAEYRERREKIYGAMKTPMPVQYKKLIEQYYKSLQEEPE